MEIKLKIIDIFPSLNELSKDSDIIISLNELEYVLKDIINKDLLISVSSYLNISISNQNQIIGEGKIELNKISRLNLNKSITTWLNLVKEKKKKGNNNLKSEILNNIFDFIKIKLQITIIKSKTTFFPIENFNKIPINKEIIKTKSPNKNKISSFYQGNILLKSYNTQSSPFGKSDNKYNNTKSISFTKKSNINKSQQNIFYKHSSYNSNNELNNLNKPNNFTSNSFIKENEDLGKAKKKRTHSKKTSSKTIKKISNNLLKSDINKEIEEYNNNNKIEENYKIPKFNTENNFDFNYMNTENKNIQNNNFNNQMIESKSDNNFIKNESIEFNEEFSFNNYKNRVLDDTDIKEKENEKDEIYNFSKNNDLNDIEYNDNPIDEEFLGLKNDFKIFYTKDYIDDINDDLLNLEIELCIEKIFDLILSYHQALKLHEIENKIEQNKIKNYIKENKILNKQILKVNCLNIINKNQNNYIQIENEIKQNKINMFKNDKSNEINVFHKLISQELNDKNEKVKKIFSKIIIKHKNKIKEPETLNILKKILPKLFFSQNKKNLQIETIPKNKRKTTSNPKGIQNRNNLKKENKHSSYNNSYSSNIILSENNKKKSIPKRSLNYSGSITAPNTNDIKFI